MLAFIRFKFVRLLIEYYEDSLLNLGIAPSFHNDFTFLLDTEIEHLKRII